MFSHSSMSFFRRATRLTRSPGWSIYLTGTSRRRRMSVVVRPSIEVLEGRTLLTSLGQINPSQGADTWTAHGPAPIEMGQTPGLEPVSGRITGLAVDPGNADHIYIAAAGGGVWETKDRGSHWKPLTDEQRGVAPESNRTLFMGAIAIAPSNSSIIYAGTGEANNSSDSYYGRGILKSSDSGATWKLLGNNVFNRRTISKIVVDPNDPNTVYVAVAAGPNGNGVAGPPFNTGIWKSVTGGEEIPGGPPAWTNTTAAITSTYSYSDLVIDPITIDPTDLAPAKHHPVLYAAVGEASGSGTSRRNGVYKTTDGAATWTRLPQAVPSDDRPGRIALAISQSNPAVLYELIATSGKQGTKPEGSLFLMAKTTDSGATWRTLRGNRIGANIPDIFGSSHQGWYDITLAVDPSNPNIVYAGGAGDSEAIGSQIIRVTTDSNASLEDVTDISGIAAKNGPHADHHAIGFDQTGALLVGTDGGIWRLINRRAPKDSVIWLNMNGNLQITQFTGVALHPKNPDIIYGGSQDNGTEMSVDGGETWTQVAGGDGGFVRVDPSTPGDLEHTTVYHSYQRSKMDEGKVAPSFLERSDKGGKEGTWKAIVSGIDQTSPSRFFPPYVIDPANSNRLLLGTNRVYESFYPDNQWSSVGHGLGIIDSLAPAPAQPNTIYATADGHVFVTHDHGATWKTIDLPGINDHFADILVDPRESTDQVAYIVRDRFDDIANEGHVFRTTDGGEHWFDISLSSSGFPDLPTWTIKMVIDGEGMDRNDPKTFYDNVHLYVGTDNGVYVSSNLMLSGGDVTWSRLGMDLPHAQVVDLEMDNPPPDAPYITLAAGTHGRGVWEILVRNPPPLPSPPPGSGGPRAFPALRLGLAAADMGSLVTVRISSRYLPETETVLIATPALLPLDTAAPAHHEVARVDHVFARVDADSGTFAFLRHKEILTGRADDWFAEHVGEDGVLPELAFAALTFK